MVELKRILLVEDNPNDAELTLMGLGKHNLANEVVVAYDGVEAIDYLYRKGKFAGRPEGNPSVIFLDLKLPKIDGIEVLRKIRADEQLKMIPVVVLSSSREEHDLTECYKLGANAYVVKPVNYDAFIDTVKSLGSFWAITNEPPPGCAKKGLT